MFRVSTRISLRSLLNFLSQAAPMAEPVLPSMKADKLSILRHRCDVYMDPRKSLREVTHFYVDDCSAVRDWAKAALNVYNEKKQTNFYLQKVVKLNQVSTSMDAYLTFWAWSADEIRLFRAVVKPLGGYNVLLCEIKDDYEMTIPADHAEYYPRIPTSEGDRSPYLRFDLKSDSADRLVGASGGPAVGQDELSILRHMCDVYIDPRGTQCGGGVTQFYVDGFSHVRDRAKTALNVYNEKEQKNFHLEKVVKLNRLSYYYYMTFWARSAEDDEHRLFRGGVDLLNGKVLLCEIKDDDEMAVPAEHEENRPHDPESEEDYSPPHSPYTWYLL